MSRETESLRPARPFDFVPQRRLSPRVRIRSVACLLLSTFILMVAVGACRSREAALPPAQAARILVASEGPIQIDARMLEDAGLNWSEQPGDDFQLFSGGRAHPLRVVEDPRSGGFRLGFFAESLRGLESGQRAYLLTKGAVPDWVWAASDTSMDGGDPDPDSDPESGSKAKAEAEARPDSAPLASEESGLVLATRRLEVDARYLPQRIDGDPWLWKMLSAPGEETIPIDLPGLAGGPARLRIGLWAATRSPQPIDHRLVVTIGGQTIGEVEWDGDGNRIIEFDIPPSLLEEPETRISLALPGIEGIAADIVHLDWLAIDYARKASLPAGEALTFVTAGETDFNAKQGPVTLFDEAGAVLADDLFPEDGRLVLDRLERGHSYTLAGPEAWRAPAAIQRAGDGIDLRAEGQGADWLAIGPADLLRPLAPLASQRETEGLTSASVDVEAVYDQFGFGRQDALAIQRFLAHAAEHWNPAPRYVLLVGDASTDPRGLLSAAEPGAAKNAGGLVNDEPAVHRMPTIYVRTEYGGITASDPMIGQIDEDPWPDLAIGRIPARKAEQVEVFVEKVLASRAQTDASPDPSGRGDLATPGRGSSADRPSEASRSNAGATDFVEAGSEVAEAWRLQVLAVADGREGTFRREAELFLDRLPEAYAPELLAPESGDEGIADRLVEQFDAGVGLVAYFGHGTVSQWGQDRLFSREDVPRLSNSGQLPIILHMTCLAGLFTHPEAESLSEALLFSPRGGAAAMLAPTSLTLGGDQSVLSNAFADALARADTTRLGDAVLRAWEALPMDRASSRDVVQTFIILGDPAQPLAPLSAR